MLTRFLLSASSLAVSNAETLYFPTAISPGLVWTRKRKRGKSKGTAVMVSFNDPSNIKIVLLMPVYRDSLRYCVSELTGLAGCQSN